ncbi:transporter substrate-binding domain-containing protein, partial [Synergistaceae bacterium OttesenSCG-928-I11]|nr:transporter substrate-binding domain-containing protein [Synergistaceae bacterium OttesenSCG-928-I11]
MILFMFLLSSAISLPAFADEHARRPYTIYTDYRDIPGVTSADIEDVERLKAAFDSFEYGAGGSNETFVLDDDGTIGGFSRYFCDWLTDLFDTPFNLSIYRLADLNRNVMDGTVDFTCEFTSTEEMQRQMAMTGTVVKRAVTRFRMANSEPPSAIAMSRPLRYGFAQWYQTAELVDASVVGTFEAFYYQRREDAISALREGEIDAFVMDSRGEGGFDPFDDILQEDFFPLAYSNASFATADPDLAPIVVVVQKFLETEDAKPFLSDIYERGEREFRRNNFRRMLSINEKSFIRQHVENGLEIPFAAEHHNYPVSFYNQREDELQGIAIDVLREISSLSGLTFKPVAPDSGKWADLRELFDGGGADMVTELIYTRRRRDGYLWTDMPYDTQHFALISHIDTPVAPFDKIADMRVGAVGGSAFEDIFRDFFPAHERFILFDGTEEAFEALGAGKIDLFMGSGNLLLFATNYLERPDFKINIAFNRISESAFAFARDQHTLRSVVSKAQMLVDTGGISRKWKQRA